MQKFARGLSGVLDALEKHYGVQASVGPSEPYEMILFVNCGYPATDTSCAKGYEALRCEAGTKPEKILAAPKAKLAKLMRRGGIVPELRAERLKTIAKIVNEEFGGDLKWSLEKLLQNEKKNRRQGDTPRQESAKGISCHWRSRRGQNSLVRETGAGNSGSFSIHRRAATHFIWRRGQELRGWLPRRTGGNGGGTTRNVRREATGVSASESAMEQKFAREQSRSARSVQSAVSALIFARSCQRSYSAAYILSSRELAR